MGRIHQAYWKNMDHDDMDHPHSHPHHDEARAEAHAAGVSLNRLAFTATVHCLSGCATGEVLGLVIGTALGWATVPTIALAVVLAFLFGYALTMIPLLRAGLAFGAVLKLALAADTVSVLIMEIVDNAIMLVIPGAMDAGLAGEVVVIEGDQVTIAHDPVDVLGWPAMTMTFQAGLPRIVNGVTVEDLVSFEIKEASGGYSLTSIAKAD